MVYGSINYAREASFIGFLIVLAGLPFYFMPMKPGLTRRQAMGVELGRTKARVEV
jgi:hypothetical protein